MHDANWDVMDPERSRLRSLVAVVDREVANVVSVTRATGAPASEGTVDSSTRLTVAWTALVTGLALGSDPELRSCPSCRRGVPRIATRCRYCLRFSDAEPALPEPG